MKWFDYILSSFNIAQKGRQGLTVISKTTILLMIIIAFLMLNCEKQINMLVAPEENSFLDSPVNVKAVVDDGSILLTWSMTTTNGLHSYHIYRKDTVAARMALIDSSFVMKYTDDNVINGKKYYYQVVAVDSSGFEGKLSAEVSARPNVFDVIIEDGRDYINIKRVTVNIIAPTGTNYMLIANDSLFTNSSWENYKSSKTWTLSQGDGLKYVYVNFRDSEGNENKSPIHDTITLDTQAVIGEVSENTNGQVKQPGDIIHITLDAGEPEGKATFDIGAEKTGISLFDDGSHGDLIANDGKYEIDYQIPSDLEVVNAIITGHFLDRANNQADDITAKTRITVQRAPAPVTLRQITPVGNSSNSLVTKRRDRFRQL